MKISQSGLKLVIKTLILLILFVLLFIISSFLYSARYWKDIYNYVNANVTIRHIPTITELELTVIKVEPDFTTETYSTTDFDYQDLSTIDDLDIDEFMKDEFDYTKKVKRHIVIDQLKDYIELPPRPIFVDYVFLESPIKRDTKPANDKEGVDTAPKETDDDGEIPRTSITGVVLEDEPPEPTVSEEPAVTKYYYTVQPTKSKSKRSIDQEPSATTQGIIYTTEIATTEYIPEHSTTKEGYLVGDDLDLSVNEVIDEPVVLTTKANENELVDDEEDTNLMRDSVDVSKLTTRGSEDVEMVTRKPWKLQMMPDPICHGDATCQEFTKTVFPWIATIFVSNSALGSQFSYYCDGVLVTDKAIVTDARCMIIGNKTLDPDSLLVFLGKVNLQTFGGNEKVQKVNSIVIHPNFTVSSDGKASNDLALILLEEAVELKDNIQSACTHQERSSEESATTAWALDGALVPIFFEKEKGKFCFDKDEDVFCASYGNEVALCPSYGGVFASRQAGRWCLHGIFYGDPADRGICFTKDVHYTSLTKHLQWIDENVGIKNGIL
ncbi:hypothetical protein PYW07_010611 [Mythimna separata]|uniref:Peptidase S1 domain-containing protein n=1 Tax=Mythimna separata TaxID=271217 RepID=A0AAD7YA89_MYTSE|nr:hypothetical protein PYW07_010611 [Mythimna separata]